MKHRKKPRKPWLVVRKQGRKPVRVVPRMHFRTKKRAQKEAKALNREYKGSGTGIKFVVRKEGWNRKRWWS